MSDLTEGQTRCEVAASAIAQKVMRELVLVEKKWKPFGQEW